MKYILILKSNYINIIPYWAFISAFQVYPYYFRKKAKHYQREIVEYADVAFYWYHLAITWLQANMTIESLYAVNKALNFISSYSSYKEKFIRLKQVIISKLSI